MKLDGALARLRGAVTTCNQQPTAGGYTPGEGKPQALCGFGEPATTVTTVTTKKVPDRCSPSPGVSPVAAHALAVEFSPASSKVVVTGGYGGYSQQRRGFEALPPAKRQWLQPAEPSNDAGPGHPPPAAEVVTARPWTDDRAWIADIVRHKDPRCDAVLALLFAWVLAAGGWIDGMTAELPALPHRHATLELRRMLRRSGIGIRDAVADGPLP